MEFLSILSEIGDFRWNDSAINVGPRICRLLWAAPWAGVEDDAPSLYVSPCQIWLIKVR